MNKKPFTEDNIRSEKEKIKKRKAKRYYLLIGLSVASFLVIKVVIDHVEMWLQSNMTENLSENILAVFTIVIVSWFFFGFISFLRNVWAEYEYKLNALTPVDDEKAEELLIAYKTHSELSNYQKEIKKTGRIRPLNCEYELITKFIEDNKVQQKREEASQRTLGLEKQLSKV